MEHEFKDIAFFAQKPYNTLHSCPNFPAGSREAARVARICETSLFPKIQVSPKHWETQTMSIYFGIYRIALFWIRTVSADIFG